MKNIAKKITAIVIAFTIIGTNSAIFNSVPVYNRDCSVVHAADKKHVEKNNEKKQTQRISYVTKRIAEYVRVDNELRKAIQTNSNNQQYY